MIEQSNIQQDPILQMRGEAQAAIAAIENNEDLTIDAKNRQISEIKAETEKRQRAHLAEQNQLEEAELQEAHEALYKFRPPNTAEGTLYPARVREQYRDLLFKVSTLDTDGIERMMNRAIQSEDTVLAQALYHEALNRGGLENTLVPTPAHRVVDAYHQIDARARKRYETFTQLQARRNDPIQRIFQATALMRDR